MGNAHPSAVKATAAVRIQSDKRIFMMSPLTLAVALSGNGPGKPGLRFIAMLLAARQQTS